MYIFAHRGASAHAPENTLEAIRIALTQEADGIEIDVHQCENEFVIIHDPWLSRTTNSNQHLSEIRFAELRKLDAGDQQQIPTLAEVFKAVDGQCDINVEIKGVSDLPALLDYINKIAAAHPEWYNKIIYSSFDHHVLQNLKRLEPGASIGALTASNPIDYASYAENLGAESANIDLTVVTREFVDDAKKRGLKVYVYTVDQKQDLLKLASWGVDGVFSNDPAHSRQVLKNH